MKMRRALFVFWLVGVSTSGITLGPLAVRAAPGIRGDTTADLLLGQLDFDHSAKNQVDGRGLDTSLTLHWGDVAIDKSVVPNRFYIGDTSNNRVLGWSSVAAFTANVPATKVLGQPDFGSTGCNTAGRSASSLCFPKGVAVDNHGNLYVADRLNGRVVEYAQPFKNLKAAGQVANLVFGQFGSFVTKTCTQSGRDGLCQPYAVALDSADNLYVADIYSNRVLVYFTPLTVTAVPGSGDTTADLVFGQSDNFDTYGCNNGGLSADSLCSPEGVAVDPGGAVYIADTFNSRVLEYDAPLSTGRTADRVFGQGDVFNTALCDKGKLSARSLCYPIRVAVDDNGNLYVADTNSNRVLEYNTPLSSDTVADRVFGQFGSFSSSMCNNSKGGIFSAVNSQSMCVPLGVAIDSEDELYVVDSVNNRVLQYDNPLTAKPSATGIVGQVEFTTNTANFLDGRGVDFSSGAAVAIDRSVSPNRVYVADTANNRVLGWGSINAFVTQQSATLAIGQPWLLTKLGCFQPNGVSATNLCHPAGVAVDNVGNLYVADTGNNRVLEYDQPFIKPYNLTANRVFGQRGDFTAFACNQSGISATSLCNPWGVAVDKAGNLYIADTGNNRVVVYSTPLAASPVVAAIVGQPNGTASTCATAGNNGLCEPLGVAVDSTGDLYVSDKNNSRVLEYDTPLSAASDTLADRVFGQPDFTTNTCNEGGIGSLSLCFPSFLTVTPGGNLYIADRGNNRVLEYNNPLASNAQADLVFGQLNQFTSHTCQSIGPDSLCNPQGIAVDGSSNLYVTDAGANRILEYFKPVP